MKKVGISIILVLLALIATIAIISIVRKKVEAEFWDAVFASDIEKVTLALKDNPDLSNALCKTDAMGLIPNMTPLFLAIANENKGLVKVLLEYGADIETNTVGLKALQWAASCSNKEIIELLVTHGAKVDGKDSSEKTALH